MRCLELDPVALYLDPVALDLDPVVVAPDLALEARGDAAAKLARFCYGDCRKLCHRKQTK